MAMPACLGYHGILALELVLAWVSFSPIFPLLAAPRRDFPHEEPPSPAPRVLCAAAATAVVTATAASTMALLRRRRRRMEAASAEQHRGLGDGIGRRLSSGAVGFAVGAAVIHTVAVVLGAPIFRRAPETAAFSLLMSSFTSLPVSVTSHRPLEAFAAFLRGTRPALHELGAMVPAACCVLGAWLGAIPLCLDWEQPWQAWPLPMCAGGLLGFSLGCLLLLGYQILENVSRAVSVWSSEWRAEKRA
ncbi:conserved unknown protein [Ectocarpus siliculosus]|uniref:Phosphatidylinositol glycan, class F n=1 Tax=Ectocarpus siliculosus TaxID=2880 RepID=D7FUR0_ECTSI|nr:conserved unknown protein [Ectocarpus siliculosus]|eukprot:CBJ31716.1 conserved unknown protein [Ectocarpus siliculosus]